MSPMIKIQYTLNLPAGTPAGDQPSSKTHSFAIDASVDGGGDGKKAYYGALRDALADTRSQVGDELTTWRDRVGKAELNKEMKKVTKDGEEDEEDDEEEEGQA
ncbi:hypothetical protein B0H34DRAFT_791962 [Crassisporium funariophilum]|nr:hypothetical protein B0H34DRAFT_791962 [Crassisporium funariophilum]